MIATSAEEAILQDAIRFPDDDLPRLVYADWLMENGHDARGEFIQIQCQLDREEPGYSLDASKNFKVHDKSVNPKIRRAADLLREFSSRDLISGNQELPVGMWMTYEWRRGFIWKMRPTCQNFMAFAKVLFSKHPINGVELSDKKPVHFYRCHQAGQERPEGKVFILGNKDTHFYAHWLPEKLFYRLDGNDGLYRGTFPAINKGYQSESVALLCLEQACLEYGRSLR